MIYEYERWWYFVYFVYWIPFIYLAICLPIHVIRGCEHSFRFWNIGCVLAVHQIVFTIDEIGCKVHTTHCTLHTPPVYSQCTIYLLIFLTQSFGRLSFECLTFSLGLTVESYIAIDEWKATTCTLPILQYFRRMWFRWYHLSNRPSLQHYSFRAEFDRSPFWLYWPWENMLTTESVRKIWEIRIVQKIYIQSFYRNKCNTFVCILIL